MCLIQKVTISHRLRPCWTVGPLGGAYSVNSPPPVGEEVVHLREAATGDHLKTNPGSCDQTS